MEAIKIANTDLRVSRFIFGTGSLFNAGPLAKRLAVLEAAVEHGFTHFDAAPYYGFGMAERDLAHVLRKHPALTGSSRSSKQNRRWRTSFRRKTACGIARLMFCPPTASRCKSPTAMSAPRERRAI